MRSIVAFREIGRGFAHIERFNCMMNMCLPYSSSNYDEMVRDMLTGYLTAMNESMEGAGSNLKDKAAVQTNDDDVDEGHDDDSVNDDDDINDHIIDTMVDVTKNVNGICDYDVSLDGAWQRRGYSSIHGFVSAIERITDKVIDVEVLTDVVLFLRKEREYTGNYQYGLVKSVEIGRDQKIRSVILEYQNHSESFKRETRRAVREIVVVHPLDELGIRRTWRDCDFCRYENKDRSCSFSWYSVKHLE